MVYILFILLLILLLINYYFVGRDFFAPSTMLSISFLVATLCSIYNLEKWKFELAFVTVFLITLALTFSFFINAIVHGYFAKQKESKKENYLTPIPSQITIVIIIFLIIVCFFTFNNVSRIAGGGSDIASMMLVFRDKNAYGTNLDDQLSGGVKQLLNVANSICYIYVFHILYFGRQLKKNNIVLNIVVIILSVCTSLMTGGRFSAMCMVIAGFFMFNLIKIRKNGKYKSFDIKTIIKTIMILIAVLYGFYAVKELVGRVSNAGVVEYITHYFGGGIPGLDLYIKQPPQTSKIWGKETFYSAIQNLRKLNVIDVPYYYIHHEFRRSNGVSIGNIYTAFRDYHYDYGWLGIFILHIFYSIFYSICYEYVKRRASFLSILIFSMIYYTLVMYPISNCFYASVLSLGFVIKMVEVIVLYRCLLEKRIRVKI